MTLLDLLGISITVTFLGGIVWLIARAMFRKPITEDCMAEPHGDVPHTGGRS